MAHCSIEEIEELNILHASIKAMHKAIAGLAKTPAYIAVDGNRFHPYEKIPHQCVIKGDGKYQNIAAASILAKTYRDDLMIAFTEITLITLGIKTKVTQLKASRRNSRERDKSAPQKIFSITPRTTSN